MFYVLDLASNETIQAGNVSTQPDNKEDPKEKFKIFLGPSRRSRNGCLQCRKRKKKCSEEHPVCSSCKHRNVECVWRSESKFKISKETHSLTKDHHRKSKSKDDDSTALSMSESSGSSLDSTNDLFEEQITVFNNDNLKLSTDSLFSNTQMIRSPNTPNFDFQDLNLLNFNLPSPINSHIFQPFKFLDNQALYFLDGFLSNVGAKFSIGQESSNYILKTFYQLSEEQESIAYALTAWGGIFIEGGFTENVNHYLNKAISEIAKNHVDMDNLSKKDIYVLLNYYMISIGLYVCGGDASLWNLSFNKSIELINKYGGLSNIVKMFDYSNEIKWLVSDVQYHDVLSSQTFHKGTCLPMEEYNSVFKEAKILELGNYGLDPFQGCIQPIYLMLGEIISKSAEFRSKQVENADINTRLEVYNEMNEVYEKLKDDINNCVPNMEQMRHIAHDKYELELHLTLFEVYSIICQISLNFLFKKLPPDSLDMQRLLLNCLNSLDILVDTKMKSALSFSLLICGITCCSESDRSMMKERFKTVSEDYKAMNLRLIRDIVEEVWKRNNNGKLYIDWILICEENNWDMSFC
ncbi:hypothetical protein SBY92_005348 [Candida maltosa Xu316]|uniref:Zn(2)-C6 fungal-type domain-containing protein n=1 Tax=Candida maltosa (strain Xu316) TaxID=1245528 RepID=M3HHG3_CANMX|nr:hypothetical protein G210_3002 [Candida maltosa Xu316]